MSSIKYSAYGNGTPLVLLHGFCEDRTIWNGIYPAFTDDHSILIPDLPGFGQSAHPTIGFSIADIAEQVAEWLASLNVEPAIVIGHSLGGYITLELAKRSPHLLAGIGLFHSTAYADTEEKKDTRNKVIAFVESNGVKAFADSFAAQLFYVKNRARLGKEIENVRQTAGETILKTLIGYTKAMRDRSDRSDVLRNFSKPILFLAGDQDTSVPIDKSKEQIPLIQNGTTHILKDTGHMGMFEAKEEAILIIRHFLDSCNDGKP